MAASPIISLSLFQPHLSPSALWTYQMYSSLRAFALAVPATWNALPPAVCIATPWPPPDIPTNVSFPARASSSKSRHPGPNSLVPRFLLLSLYGTNHCLTSFIWFMYVVYCLPPHSRNVNSMRQELCVHRPAVTLVPRAEETPARWRHSLSGGQNKGRQNWLSLNLRNLWICYLMSTFAFWGLLMWWS